MSVHKLVRNGRTTWKVQWRADGRQCSKTFPHERDANRYEREVRRELDRGRYPDPHDTTTVGEYAAYYLGTKSHAESSRKIYRGYLRRINATPLGARPLGQVRPTEVTGWVSRQQQDGLAPVTVRLMVSFLRSVYAAAVEDDKCLKSPVPLARKLSLGSADDDGDVVVPTVEQVDAFTDAMERDEPRCRAMVLAQAGLGLRIGELLALRRQDIDFDRREVAVCGRVLVNSRVRVAGTKGSRGKRLKTRVVPLLPEVAEELAEHMLLFPPRAAGGAAGALFTDAAGRLWTHGQYARLFLRARAAAGLSDEITSHALRHHFCSVALSNGVPTTDVKTFLGHTDTRLVDKIYGHVMGDAGARFRAAMGRTWGQQRRDDVAPGVAPQRR